MVSMGVVIRMAMHTGIQMPMTMRTVMTTHMPRLRTTAMTTSTMPMAPVVRMTMAMGMAMTSPKPDVPTCALGPRLGLAP